MPSRLHRMTLLCFAVMLSATSLLADVSSYSTPFSLTLSGGSQVFLANNASGASATNSISLGLTNGGGAGVQLLPFTFNANGGASTHPGTTMKVSEAMSKSVVTDGDFYPSFDVATPDCSSGISCDFSVENAAWAYHREIGTSDDCCAFSSGTTDWTEEGGTSSSVNTSSRECITWYAVPATGPELHGSKIGYADVSCDMGGCTSSGISYCNTLSR